MPKPDKPDPAADTDASLHAGEVRLRREGVDHRFRQITTRQQIFDIYLPDVLCELRATARFIRKLSAFSAGATHYRGLVGDWNDVSEGVRVLRMSITTVNHDGEVLWSEHDVREVFRHFVCEFMVDLRESHGHREEAIFFNDWSAQATVVLPCEK